jgi:alkyl sulfatase BDS1-like metallo-beta-lactamase superfamily hydrolase
MDDHNDEKSSQSPMGTKPPADQAIQVLEGARVHFRNPRPDIFVAEIPIANAGWVKTSEGAVVIDSLERGSLAQPMLERIHETAGPIKYLIFTHGHGDHTGGWRVFLQDGPKMLAQRLIVDRFEKYRILARHRARITSIQFNLPPFAYPMQQDPPVELFDEFYSFKLGGKSFEIYHACGETDDHAWVWVPELRAAFVGDLIIMGFPNIGNPFKPTRFALPWARSLEAVKKKNPDIIIAGGGKSVYEGPAAAEILDVLIEAIYSVHDQVVSLINEGVPVEEMVDRVKLPAHLSEDKRLRFVYSRLEFAVYNIYHWYHGYFDHNPAHLLPRPPTEVNRELFDLIGDGPILEKAGHLLEKGQAQLALQVLDVLLSSQPDHVKARRLRLAILEILAREDFCLMSRNTWVYFIDQDKKFLAAQSSQETVPGHGNR